jgi:hypothetical protein
MARRPRTAEERWSLGRDLDLPLEIAVRFHAIDRHDFPFSLHDRVLDRINGPPRYGVREK